MLLIRGVENQRLKANNRIGKGVPRLLDDNDDGVTIVKPSVKNSRL